MTSNHKREITKRKGIADENLNDALVHLDENNYKGAIYSCEVALKELLILQEITDGH